MQTMKMGALKQALDAGSVDELYDNRGSDSYNNLHLAGASQLSVSEVEGRLPENKHAMLVFY
ncbi:MAG: hypothetical protein K8I27_02915 [Planctomycetes bacterium]|nr:hypothetical protein [Planctomycetota bacterium]